MYSDSLFKDNQEPPPPKAVSASIALTVSSGHMGGRRSYLGHEQRQQLLPSAWAAGSPV